MEMEVFDQLRGLHGQLDAAVEKGDLGAIHSVCEELGVLLLDEELLLDEVTELIAPLASRIDERHLMELSTKWLDAGRTSLEVCLPNARIDMYRSEVQTLIDGLECKETQKPTTCHHRWHLEVSFAGEDSCGEEHFHLDFGPVSFQISGEQADVLVPMLRKRLEEPEDYYAAEADAAELARSLSAAGGRCCSNPRCVTPKL
jgi:hypothetical protein